jgi:hypothetical protein
MPRALAAILLIALTAAMAAAQQPPASWQDLALREQQNATLDKMIANGMITVLQSEIADLKAQLGRLKDPPVKDPPVNPAPTEQK